MSPSFVGPRGIVGGLDQQPIVAARSRLRMHAHEVPIAAEFLTAEREFEVPLGIAFARIAFRNPMTAIPHDHRSGPILILRNHPFEITVFERMIFDMNREALIAGNETRTLGNRPTLQDAVEFEPKIIMQPAGSMLLHDETQISGLAVSRVVRPEGSMVFEKSRLRL